MMKYITIFLAIMIVIVSCNKKPTINQTREDMLRSGRWTIQSGTVTMRLPDGRDTTVNYLNFLPQCHQDDYIIFHGGSDAAMFSGGNKCDPSDPDSITFKWGLGNNYNTISLYHGWKFVYGVIDSILPLRFVTNPRNPSKLDTIYGVNDTLAGYTKILIVRDSAWFLKFDSVGLVNNDIYNASITNFSQSAFTINFWVYSNYFDSTGHRTGVFYDSSATPPVAYDFPPIQHPDTLKYTITYKNN